VNERVRRLLYEAESKQRLIAARCGVSIATVRHWERGGLIPEDFQHIIDALAEEYMEDSTFDREMKWIHRGFDLARLFSDWSKDPSTRVGAVIMDDLHRVLGHGYNGFPRGVQDLEERLEDRRQKYQLIVHAEVNAIVNAVAPVVGGTMFITAPPCQECTKVIVQAGIKRVLALPPPKGLEDRWAESYRVSREIFLETAVQFTLHMGYE